MQVINQAALSMNTKRFSPQLRTAMCVVGAHEYDVAASRCPASCPHVLTGDFRTGQQLLDDAPADARRTIADLAQAQDGLLTLDRIAVYLETQTEGILRERPESAAAWPSWAFDIQRPLALGFSAVAFDGESPVMSFMARHELATACARRIWNIGFEPSRLANVVGAAPPRLLAALRRLLGAAQRAGEVQARRLLMAGVRAETAADGPASPPCGLQGKESGEAAWEMEGAPGIALVQFEPATQRRLRFACNSRLAALWGCHKEEMLSRFAAHEGRFHLAPLPALCTLAAEGCAASDGDGALYQVFTFGAGPGCRAMLVRADRRRKFDALGRLMEVRFLISPSSSPSSSSSLLGRGCRFQRDTGRLQ